MLKPSQISGLNALKNRQLLLELEDNIDHSLRNVATVVDGKMTAKVLLPTKAFDDLILQEIVAMYASQGWNVTRFGVSSFLLFVEK